MRALPFAAALAGATALTACAPAGAPETAPAPPMVEADCGAASLGSYIGTPGSDAALAAIRSWRGDKPVRVLTPGAMMTMDYRADRLNIELDDKGVIAAVRCG